MSPIDLRQHIGSHCIACVIGVAEAMAPLRLIAALLAAAAGIAVRLPEYYQKAAASFDETLVFDQNADAQFVEKAKVKADLQFNH